MSSSRSKAISRAVGLGLSVGAGYLLYKMWKGFDPPKPRPLVVCGPSGVGKGTVLDILDKEYPGVFAKVVSHTTRQPRKGEVHGVHYYFTDKKSFEDDIKEGLFIEYANVHGNLYGTSTRAVKDIQNKGKICILEIDVQGAENIANTSLNPHFFFLLPPTLEDLENRLVNRGTEDAKTIRKRMRTAVDELSYLRQEGADYIRYRIINEELSECYRTLRATLNRLYPFLKSKRKSTPKKKGSK